MEKHDERPLRVPAAIYSRVSTEEQKTGDNIDVHVRALNALMLEQGNYLWDTKLGIYKDEAYSGAILARPELDRLRDDAKLGRYQIVYFLHPDRIARFNHYIGLVINELRELGIRFVFKNTPVGDDPQGDLMLNIYGSFAEYERAVISDRFRAGKRHKAQHKKLIVGGVAPYGIRYIKKDKEGRQDGYYELVPDEALVVKKMFELIDARDFTARKLTRWLNEHNVPTRKGGKWTPSTVYEILHRTEYIGMAYYNKRESVLPKQEKPLQGYRRRLRTAQRLRPRDQWIPIPVPQCKIIPEGTFQRVQEKLERNRIFSNRNTKHEYLVKQLLRCQCGYAWQADHYAGYTYYRCPNRSGNVYPYDGKCSIKSIPAKKLDSLVWNALTTIVLRPGFITQSVEKFKESCSGNSTIEKDIQLENKCVTQREQEKKRIWDAYKAGVISLRRYQEEDTKITATIQNHQRNVRELSAQKVNGLPAEFVQNSFEALRLHLQRNLKLLEHDFPTRQKLVRSFVREGLVSERNITFRCRIPCGAQATSSLTPPASRISRNFPEDASGILPIASVRHHPPKR